MINTGYTARAEGKYVSRGAYTDRYTYVYPYIYLYSAPERHPRSTSMNQKYKKTTAKEDNDKKEEETVKEGEGEEAEVHKVRGRSIF